MANLEDDSTSLDHKQAPSHDTMQLTPPHHLPWLILDSHHPFYIENQCFVSSQVAPRTFESNPTRSYYQRNCVGSVEGWLIVAESISKSSPIVNFFLNPISDARLTLPSQSTISSPENHRHNFFHKVVASSAPTGEQRCLVAGLYVGRRLAFCRPTHNSWTIIKGANVEDLGFYDIEIVGRKLYAATNNLLMVFGMKDGRRLISYKVVESVRLHYDSPVKWPYDQARFEDGPYLAKDATSKELFMIFRDVSFSKATWYRTEGFRVLKLEYSNFNDSRWVEVSDLGDRILFVSKFGNKLIISSGNDVLSGNSHDKTLERNCIYFAFDWPLVVSPGGDFGVFSLTNKRVIPLSFPEDQCPAELFKGRTVWFTPNA